MNCYIAIDIGGTKTAVGILDEDLNLLCVDNFPTTPDRGCADLVRRAYDFCAELLRGCGKSYRDVVSLCALTPGPVDPAAGVIRHIPTMGWRDEPILTLLQDRFGCPVVLEHDVGGAALGEWKFGSGAGHGKCLVYITVSTGVGCGIVLDGRIFGGAHDAAGELGHINVVKDGDACQCGGRGCLEAYASGTAIARIASGLEGRAVSAGEVFTMATQGNGRMKTVVAQASRYLGYAISLLYQLFDPSIVILGGSVMKNYDIMKPYMEEAIWSYTQTCKRENINITCTKFPNNENALLGAAYLAKTSHSNAQG
jgi:glucokinase